MDENNKLESVLRLTEETTDFIELSSATMHARRSKRSVWALILIGAPKAAVKGVQHVSQSAYEAGRSLFTGPTKQKAQLEPVKLTHQAAVATAGSPFPSPMYQEAEIAPGRFKQGKAQNYPQIPAGAVRNPDLANIREQYQRTTTVETVAQQRTSGASSFATGLSVEGSTSTSLSSRVVAGPKLVEIKLEESLVDYSEEEEEEEEEVSDENVVVSLLSAWMNLRPRPNQE